MRSHSCRINYKENVCVATVKSDWIKSQNDDDDDDDDDVQHIKEYIKVKLLRR